MADLGRINRLSVVKQVDFGVFLDGGVDGNILLPKRYVPKDCELGQQLKVFIYLDSEDQLIATTEMPKIMVGQCAYLKVKDVNKIGAFLDWGLSKDLFVPFKEQAKRMEEGKSYVVYAYLDSSERIVASSRLDRHLYEESRYFKANQEVDLMVYAKTAMGYKAVVNNNHIGLIFRDEAFKPLRFGQQFKGYIKSIREDGKIDLSLQRRTQKGRDELTDKILQYLKANGGTSTLTDKSPPDEIYNVFNVSKGNYKKALGSLYKERKIVITPERITLVEE
ncbi:S1-like domain-containing RNA-binding protein [Maricurvus nonylphenolicus]|uniref:CvfB family protein n=1 Tax=Maricurvus nonylphenolicus TaxID=1008307 RepID=UPI0036F3B295